MQLLSPLESIFSRIVEKVLEGVYELYKPRPVRYRDVIILRHVATNYSLHSHSIPYSHPGTSGQQQVTAWGGLDMNDYWIVKGPYGQSESYKQGEAIRHGDIVRLGHLNTHTNLHSHWGHPSPSTGQQEVTTFGRSEEGDANDNWRVEDRCKGIWYRGKRVKLIHIDTNHALHSHAGFYVGDQQEVTCFDGRDDNDWWKIDK